MYTRSFVSTRFRCPRQIPPQRLLASLTSSVAFAMTSPPLTPSAEISPDFHPRFKVTGAPCEWAEDYRPGGFHPVNLGDTFHGGTYRVIRKLGEGSYSTVWLAVSTGYVHPYFMFCITFLTRTIVIAHQSMSLSRS
jgi:serine/threonine protein kinase